MNALLAGANRADTKTTQPAVTTPEPEQGSPELQGSSAKQQSSDRTQYEFTVLRSIRRIIRAVDLYSKRLAHDHGVTSPQLVCLSVVVQEGSLTVSDIAARVHLSASTVVGILDRLAERGLLHRERGNTDRRRVFITATEQGKEMVEAAPSLLQDKLASRLRGLPELEQATIALSLDRVVGLMEASGIDAAPILETRALTEDLG